MKRRDGARREIPWSELGVSMLSPEARAIVGRDWLSRMKSEHLAVSAFSTIACELAEVGCEPIVLEMITRAAVDEVRHTDVCKRLAEGFLGREAVPQRLKGVPKIPRHEHSSTTDRALLHVVEMCCFNETFTGIYLGEMLERTTDVAARAAIESLLEDEVDHGRVGWAHLSACCREGFGAATVERALPTLMQRSVGPVIAAANQGHPRDARLEAHGWLSASDGATIYRQALADVVFPGLEAVGVDVGEARGLAASRGFIT